MNDTGSKIIKSWRHLVKDNLFKTSLLIIGLTFAPYASALTLISHGNSTTPISPCASGSLKYSPMCLFPDIVDGILQSTVFTCNKGVNRGTSFVGSEAEPHIAVNPTNPNNMAAMWIQDRWARLGGGNAVVLAYTKDGGVTWKLTNPLLPFSRCAGASEASNGAYDHGTDPWVVFDKKGTLYAQTLAFDGLAPRPGGAILISKSTDGGETWGSMAPVVFDVVIKEGGGLVPLLDKNTMTADPVREGAGGDPILYTTWAYFQSNNKADIYVSRSFDGAQTWENKKKIYTLENDLPKGVKATDGTLGGPLIEVMKDGTLILTFAKDAGKRIYSLIRSFNGGNNWETSSTTIATINTPFGLLNSQVYDPELLDASGAKIPIRDAIGGIADSSLNPARDIIYFVYQDADANTGKATVMIKRSTDNGTTWSKAVKVNNSTADAFEPVVAVAANGTVGVLYVDMRNDVLGPPGCDASTCGPLSADMFLAQFTSDLKPKGGNLNAATTRVTPTSIDYRQAPLLFGAGGVVPGGLFLGDYQGLTTANGNFNIAIAVTNNLCPLVIPQNPNAVAINECNRDDIYYAQVLVK